MVPAGARAWFSTARSYAKNPLLYISTVSINRRDLTRSDVQSGPVKRNAFTLHPQIESRVCAQRLGLFYLDSFDNPLRRNQFIRALNRAKKLDSRVRNRLWQIDFEKTVIRFPRR